MFGQLGSISLVKDFMQCRFWGPIVLVFSATVHAQGYANDARGVLAVSPDHILDRNRYLEQLKHRGIVDANRNKFIAADEVDAREVPGGLAELRRVAGPDGILAFHEVRYIRSRRSPAVEAIVTNDATQWMRELTATIRSAANLLGKVNVDQTDLRELDAAAREINRAGFLAGDLARTRRRMGIADRSAAIQFRSALRDLGERAVNTLDGSAIQVGQDSREHDEMLRLRASLATLREVAWRVAGVRWSQVSFRIDPVTHRSVSGRSSR